MNMNAPYSRLAGKPTEMSGQKKHKLWFYFGIPDIN
jgi:hypothetical protein